MSQHARHCLFLMTDQQRWDTVAGQQPWIQTPHLDALFNKQKTRHYRQAICNAPMCTP